MDNLDMFQSRLENIKIWLVGFRRNFNRCRYVIYLHGVPGLMSNPLCSFHVSSPVSSGNEQTSRSDMENVTYNCRLTYGTCESFGSLTSFHINVYGISYFTGTDNQRPDKQRRRANHTI